ncbi:transcriptional regulator [Microvirga sp. KLBC 81]|uniref:helix-turn-helix domain-containing protein n=1 Tax=Microvirga sp. KLBC 81 TaxID=1862707 RepID=UPI000D5181F3|nr:transcriptional regulator [Microvirga sp. KLBC 81]
MRSIYTTQQETLCMLLRHARKKAGLTQVQLEKRLRAYRGYVSKYENGERELTLRELLEIAEALGIDPLSIMKPNS